MVLSLFMFCCVLCPVVIFHCLSFDACMLICNECICLRLLGWCTPRLFFITFIFRALGLRAYFGVSSKEYKDKEEGGGFQIPPHTMETDSMTTWQQDSVVISRDEAAVGTPQRRCSRKVARNANEAMKSLLRREGGSTKSQAGGAPKRQAVSSPQVGELYGTDALYVPGSESESEDEDMCVVSEDEGLAPGPSYRISTDDWDEEQHTSLGMCAANMKRLSLGPDYDASAWIEAKDVKKEPPTKKNVKRAKRTTRERLPGHTYKWVLPCYDVKEVSKPCPGYKKPKVLAIWATCKLCRYKDPDFKAFGVKTKISNCPSWSGCVKHVENLHYLHDPKDLEEALANPKAHWNDLEDKKGRLRGVETRLQGQTTMDECVEEYGRGSGERKRCIVNLARLCTVENLPLHIGTRPGFVKFMRKWEARWPSISKQNVTRSVERQSEELRKDIRKEMEGVAAQTDIAFTTDFWTSPTGESFVTMSMH